MKKIFFRILPYILFTLAAALLFVIFTGITYGIGVILCLIAEATPTLGILWFAVIFGITAVCIFIVEEL